MIPTSNHNSPGAKVRNSCVVYLLIPTSNHNWRFHSYRRRSVVYLLIPTSNHNYFNNITTVEELYIFWFLHQTTTADSQSFWCCCCISFDSYIKPQPRQHGQVNELCCISFDSYIKPQRRTRLLQNPSRCISFDSYIKPQPVVGVEGAVLCCISFDSYIKPQPIHNYIRLNSVVYLLIPTSNHNLIYALTLLGRLYIFWFLHQTTTWALRYNFPLSCISFDSYIKPQLWGGVGCSALVVYLLIPTSNHNYLLSTLESDGLYIFWFLHQTTTQVIFIMRIVQLYIFWFLHQTTTQC